jgi:hypothetical protein
MVTSIGTILPSRMYSLIMAPKVEPGRFCSARRRSPATQSDQGYDWWWSEFGSLCEDWDFVLT